MKHFFPSIAQDIRKAKSENIKLFKNVLNKLLNIKNYLKLYNHSYAYLITCVHSGITSKFTFALHYTGIYSKPLRKLWRLTLSSDRNFNHTKSTMIMTIMTFLNIKFSN